MIADASVSVQRYYNEVEDKGKQNDRQRERHHNRIVAVGDKANKGNWSPAAVSVLTLMYCDRI